MAKDVLGNELKVGDLVQIKLDNPTVYGHIASISEGGISLVGGAKHGKNMEMVTPGVITATVELSAQFNPQDGKAPGILKCHEPKEDEGKKPGGVLLAN